MNWFKKATDNRWPNKINYHLENTMKFELDNFPDLSFSGGGDLSMGKISFDILKNNGENYSFAIRINGNKIDSIISARPFRLVGSGNYIATQSTPQQIIRDGLIDIDNDQNGEFDNGMV